MEITVIDYISSCRTCLNSKPNLQSIFEESLNGEKLSSICSVLCSVSISIGDEISHKICEECKFSLIKAYEFRKMVIESHETARAFNFLNRKRKSAIVVSDSELAFPMPIEVKEETTDDDIYVVETLEEFHTNKTTSPEIFTNDHENDEDQDSSEDSTSETDSESEESDDESDSEVLQTQEQFQLPWAQDQISTTNNYEETGETSTSSESEDEEEVEEENSEDDEEEEEEEGQNMHENFNEIIQRLRENYFRKESSKNFKCDICDKSFQFPSGLKRHQKACVDTKPRNTKKLTIFCQICDKGFAEKTKLVIHLKTHDLNDNIRVMLINQISYPLRAKHVCLTCNQQFYFAHNYEKHQILHSKFANECYIKEPRQFQCVICLHKSPDFTTFSSHLNEHKQQKENDSKQFTCKICDQKFGGFNTLMKHARKHPENATHRCKKCQEYFSWGNSLIEHIEMHQGLCKFKCHICSKGFSNNLRLDSHIKTHTRTEADYKYECTVCQKRYFDKNYLKTHMKTHEKKLFECKFCQKTFTFPKRLKEHLLIHTGKPFECKICSHKFTQRYLLNKHILSHHNPNIKFECDLCGKSFPNKLSIKQHMISHTYVKSFECQICHLTFERQFGLKMHLSVVHNGSKSYPCSICSKSFARRHHLKQHIESHKHPKMK